ncbi:hypothetical protein LSA36186_11710 [Lachnoanaerobaculum sp. JCM 36186]|jgi:hypothetical protein|uniref:dynamin family protein n=1 Tax=Lachnoanaerobaculum sanguinis TaxID=3065809 RepID=UPI00274609E2|nr:dynamin family protein [Lachnoanaerobaculum sp. JCM 36186]GMO02922.1 hypothetical protein LSA36186_11710 [Lachnoanaerobaculum sp. JCM 36186]
MVDFEKLQKISNLLGECNNKELAGLLANFIESHSKGGTKTVGFVGDDLVGKSTIINYILGENVLPTTIIPTTPEITIKYGDKYSIYDEQGVMVPDSDLVQLEEISSNVTIVANNSYLKDKSLEFKEFHGLFSKKKLDDISLMIDIYKCDAVVLVMTAEHLLSETETMFISNYIKYGGAKNILLVINKLSLVADSDADNVIDYVEKQIQLKFSEVEWSIFDDTGKYEKILNKYNKTDVKKEFEKLLGPEKINDEYVLLKGVLEYIKTHIESQKLEVEKLEKENIDEIKNNREKLLQQKELEAMSIESTMLEFQQRQHDSIEEIDTFIKREFDKLSVDINDRFSDAVDKFLWYNSEFEDVWENGITAVASRVDEYVTSRINDDTTWLNSFFHTNLSTEYTNIDIKYKGQANEECGIDYGKYRKYLPIGIAGGVGIGFFLFRIIGAVISIGGGFLAYTYLKLKDIAQSDELKNKINSKIRDISYETRKASNKEITKIYEDILREFKREASEFIEMKYKINDIEVNSHKEEIDTLTKIIRKIEEI